MYHISGPISDIEVMRKKLYSSQYSYREPRLQESFTFEAEQRSSSLLLPALQIAPTVRGRLSSGPILICTCKNPHISYSQRERSPARHCKEGRILQLVGLQYNAIHDRLSMMEGNPFHLCLLNCGNNRLSLCHYCSRLGHVSLFDDVVQRHVQEVHLQQLNGIIREKDALYTVDLN